MEVRIRAMLLHPLWGSATDAEIARDLGASLAAVKRERASLAADLDLAAIMSRATELAELLGWDGPIGDIVEGALAERIAAERKWQSACARMTGTDEARTYPPALRGTSRCVDEQAAHEVRPELGGPRRSGGDTSAQGTHQPAPAGDRRWTA